MTGENDPDETATTDVESEADDSTEGTDSSLSKDQAVRDVLKGAGVVYGGLVINMALAFIAQRFAAVHLSIAGFGGLTTGTAVLSLGGIVAGLGLSSGMTRYLPRVDPELKRPLAKYAYALILPIGIVLGLAIVFSAELIASEVFSSPDVAVSIKIFGATIPFAAILNVAIGGIRGQKISRFQVYVENLLHPATRFALIITAVLLGAGQAGFALAYAIPFVVGAAISTALFERVLPNESDSDAAWQKLPEVLRYSFPMTVSKLASFIYRSIDIFLLLYFVGSTAVGIYGVAYAFARLMGMFSTAFNYLGSPISSELESEDRLDEAIDVQRGIARWLTIASICALVPMALFANELLGIIYRPNYAAGGLALGILAVGFAINNVLTTHGPLLSALGLSKLSAFNTTSAAAVNLGLNLLLIPEYSYTGAAAATAVSFLVLGVLPAIEVKYYAGSVPVGWNVCAPIGLAVPLAGAAYFVAEMVPPNLAWILLFGALFSVVYLGTIIVVLGFTATELMIVRSFQERFGLEYELVDRLLERFS